MIVVLPLSTVVVETDKDVLVVEVVVVPVVLVVLVVVVEADASMMLARSIISAINAQPILDMCL